MVRLAGKYRADIVLEHEDGEPATATILVDRLDPERAEAFLAGMRRLDDPPSEALLGGRRPDEQERGPDGRFKVPERVVKARRLEELSPEARAAYDRASDEDERWARAFVQSAIEAHVSVPPGEIVGPDGDDVRDGATLVRLFASNASVLRQIVLAIRNENVLGPLEKKGLRSLSVSRRSSATPPPGAAGPRPGPTAASAGTGASAGSAAATAAPGPSSTPAPAPTSSGPAATT